MNDPWKITALDSASSSHIANTKISLKNHIREKLERVHKFSEITQLHQQILGCSQVAMTTCRSLLEPCPWSHFGCTDPEMPPDCSWQDGAQRTQWLLTSATPWTFPSLQPAAPGLFIKVKEGNLESFYSAFPILGIPWDTERKTVKEFTMQRNSSLRSETHSSWD